MTHDCVKQLDKLRRESEAFRNLSIEQLLYEAVRSSDFVEVETVLNDLKKSELGAQLDASLKRDKGAE